MGYSLDMSPKYLFGRTVSTMKFFATLGEFKEWFQETSPFLGAESCLYEIVGQDANLLYRPMGQHRVQYLQSEAGDRIFKSESDRIRWTRGGRPPTEEEILEMTEDHLLEEIVKDRHPGTDYNKNLASLLLKKGKFTTFTEVGLNGKFIGVRKQFDDIRTVRIKWRVEGEADINQLLESRLPDVVEIQRLSEFKAKPNEVVVTSNELF